MCCTGNKKTSILRNIYDSIRQPQYAVHIRSWYYRSWVILKRIWGMSFTAGDAIVFVTKDTTQQLVCVKMPKNTIRYLYKELCRCVIFLVFTEVRTYKCILRTYFIYIMHIQLFFHYTRYALRYSYNMYLNL